MKIILVNPPLRSPTNRFGVGFQLPLGLVMIGGPLVDAGHEVSLIDADAMGLRPDEAGRLVGETKGDVVLVGHSGSTAAHPSSLDVFRAVKSQAPQAVTIYGGVYPTYASDLLLRRFPFIDVVVKGEGEETALELINRLDGGSRDLANVAGIAWRSPDGHVQCEPPRAPIKRLDDFRVGWELADWSLYAAFGLPGPAAGIQFSRGCQRSCTYCGQWGFWKRWRHRSIPAFVDDVQLLHDQYGVRALWFADENWGDDPLLLEDLLTEMASRRLQISGYCSMCASDVDRDRAILELYREAGIRFVLMGVESYDDAVLDSVRKDNPHVMVKRVVNGLRRHGILSVVNYIFGVRGETHGSMWRALRHVVDLDADFVNALYFTPHGWTDDGSKQDPEEIIQLDQSRWGYRNQVIDAGGLGPWSMFLWVKLIELLAHVRPRWMTRLLKSPHADSRRLRRWCVRHISMVWLYEIWQQTTSIRFRKPGPIDDDDAEMLLPRGKRRRKEGRGRLPVHADVALVDSHDTLDARLRPR